MTTKYESVLSESERNRICIQASAGKQGLQSDRSVSRATEQAVLAKLQLQLDAIGAGGVSWQRVSLGGQPFRKQPVCYVEPACTIEGMGGYRVCRDGDGFPVYRYPHTPEGYKLVPIAPTPQQIHAMRTGSYKDWPSDDLCRVRYAAMLAAAPTPDKE